MVRKVKGGFKAFSGTKGALSKKPKSKKAAIAQHLAVQASQYRRGERATVVSPMSGKPTGWKPDGAGRFKKMAKAARSGRVRKPHKSCG
ncbi:MAG: hypothetical protein ACETWB_02410 [Anaerolineae bacterium]